MLRRFWPAKRRPSPPLRLALAECRAEVLQALVQGDIPAANARLASALPMARVSVEIDSGRTPGAAIVRWTASASGSVFSFHHTAYDQFTHDIFERWFHLLPIPLRTMAVAPTSGTCLMNLGDEGHAPGLACCDNRPEYELIPDFIFLAHEGYADVARDLAALSPPFRERAPLAFWRGSTTGRRTGGVLDLPRVQLCLLGKRMGAKADFGISRMVQLEGDGEAEALEAAEVLRDFVPAASMGGYQLLIDIDGNTNAWPGLLTKLHSGSPVLKVQSPFGFRQWYYDRLVPWENFVPIRSDMADLEETIDHLLARPDLAEAIGRAGQALAREMTYEREIDWATPVVSAALRRGAGG